MMPGSASRRSAITDAIISLFNGPNSPGMRELQAMQPETPRVSAPVPDAGPSVPVPTAAAPRMSKKRGGILGALESIFMPEADSRWAAALRGGIYDAKANQTAYKQGTANNAAVLAEAQAKAALAQQKVARGEQTVVGNNVYNYKTGEFLTPPQQPGETERLIDKWHAAKEAGDEALADIYERAIKGFQYTPGVIDRQAEGRARAAERGAAARARYRAPPASSKIKPPAGFILD